MSKISKEKLLELFDDLYFLSRTQEESPIKNKIKRIKDYIINYGKNKEK
jgi:hypothetical protein